MLHLHRLGWGLGGRAGSLQEDLVRQKILGVDFPNPVGLAAGYDKYGLAIPAFERLGFGFIEAGSVTPIPQIGNSRPRMHRLKADRAMINHMGLNNPGHEALLRRIRNARKKLSRMPVIINLAKGKDQEDPAADYLRGIKVFKDDADMIVLNFSCPNVTGFKNLQDPEEAENILKKVRDLRAGEDIGTPVFVKIGPDLPPEKLEALTVMCVDYGIEGIVAVNLTHDRPAGLKTKKLPEQGGLSGPPMKDLATKTISDVYRYSGGKLVITGVGGIANATDAYEKIRAGASLLELYTALVYSGTGLVAEIVNGLDLLLRRDGFKHISEAVGSGH
jgi:dihydroorotate dehydrogenase